MNAALRLIGPTHGLPLMNFPAFYAEAYRLRDLGYRVINPVEGACTEQLSTMSGVVMLKGWENDQESVSIHEAAKYLGLVVHQAGKLTEKCPIPALSRLLSASTETVLA